MDIYLLVGVHVEIPPMERQKNKIKVPSPPRAVRAYTPVLGKGHFFIIKMNKWFPDGCCLEDARTAIATESARKVLAGHRGLA